MAEPHLAGGRVTVPDFGDDKVVELLAGLLDDADVFARERAVSELGETHNVAALPHIRRAMRDKSVPVRNAAVAAAAEIGGEKAEQIILAALDAKESTVLLAALRAAMAPSLPAAAGKIGRLLSHGDAQVRAAALQTLSFMGRAADASQLKALLADSSVNVRLRAAENAMLLKSPQGVLDDLLKAADKSTRPAVRAAAIEAIGTLDFEQSKPLIAAAGADKHPLVRRAAARVYRRLGISRDALPFLNDGSSIVRFVAIKTAGDLQSAESVPRLVEIMLNTGDDQSHHAARDALLQIAAPPVPQKAADLVPELMDKLENTQRKLDAIRKEQEPLLAKLRTKKKLGKKQQAAIRKRTSDIRRRMDTLSYDKRMLRRNVISCCYILGEMKSKAGYEYLLKLLVRLPIQSPILGELALVLGKIGNSRAVGPLQTMLRACHKQARPYLVALASMRMPPPFSEDVSGKIIQSLGMLKSGKDLDEILSFATINVMGMGLDKVACYAARTMPLLVRPENRQKVHKFLVLTLSGRGASLTTRWYAAKSAGMIKARPALPALRELLENRRPCLSVMRVSAWAIQQITSQTPHIPQPKLQQGDWIMRRIVKE